MKKILSIIFILSLTTMITYAFAENERGYISVSANSNADISPDLAEISFAVQTSDTKSIQIASAKNKEISDKVLSTLSSMLNVSNGDYIKTSDYNASPTYTYSNGKRIFEKYEVSNRVIVHTKSLDKVGLMIDKAIEAGATNVSSLNFSVSSYDKKCDELLIEASKKAHARANIIAKNLGASVNGIRTFDTNCNSNGNSSPRMYYAKNMLTAVAEDSASGSIQTSISSGNVKVYANVNATFYVK